MLQLFIAHVQLCIAFIRHSIGNHTALDNVHAYGKALVINGQILQQGQLMTHFDDSIASLQIVIARMRSYAVHSDVAIHAALTAHGEAVIHAPAFHIKAAQRPPTLLHQQLIANAGAMAIFLVAHNEHLNRALGVAKML